MRVLVSLAVALALAGAAPAGEKKDDTRRQFKVKVEKGVSYNDAKDADEERHTLDIYAPEGFKDAPILIHVHGGGWNRGDKKSFAKHGEMFASRGIACVAINYRLSPAVKHPEHAQDVAKAVAWVKKNAKFGDVRKIFLSGHSAGGHLVALVGSDEKYLKAEGLYLKDVKGVIPISGVFVINPGKKNQAFGEDAELCKAASPQTHVKGGLPPFLLFYADKEIAGLGKQAEAFTQAMKKVKCAVAVHQIKDRDHGTVMTSAASATDPVAQAIVEFIGRHSQMGKKGE